MPRTNGSEKFLRKPELINPLTATFGIMEQKIVMVVTYSENQSTAGCRRWHDQAGVCLKLVGEAPQKSEIACAEAGHIDVLSHCLLDRVINRLGKIHVSVLAEKFELSSMRPRTLL